MEEYEEKVVHIKRNGDELSFCYRGSEFNLAQLRSKALRGDLPSNIGVVVDEEFEGGMGSYVYGMAKRTRNELRKSFSFRKSERRHC